MKRPLCIVLFATIALACKATEPAPSASPNASPSAVPAPTPKATDPSSLKTLTLDPAASKFNFVAAKITREHDGAFKQYSGTATVVDGCLTT